jgi:PhnB protein
MAQGIREGFRTMTPYIVVADAAGLIEFVKGAFAAEEVFRAIGSAGGIHCEMRVGDCMLMIGGGGRGLSWSGTPKPMAFHIYVRDTDAVYRLALDRGAESLQAPADQHWGERTANVKDPFGNHWYIATFQGENYYSEGAPTVQPYLHPTRSEPVIEFLEKAFGAVEMGRATSPAGALLHTTLKIGDSAMELTDAAGPYQPMPSTFYLYVPAADAVYRKALAAGATSMSEPADQPYGDRTAAVRDPWGNEWYIATHIGQATGQS